jgi:hypothetical protein
MKSYWVVWPLIGFAQAGSYYPTTTLWQIFQSSGQLQVISTESGTCITTGTYGTPNCPKSEAKIATVSPTSTTSLPDASCVVACATQTCPGIATDTACFCSRSIDIGFCMVGDCRIPYQTATVLAQRLCGMRNTFRNPKRLDALTDTNPLATATDPIDFPCTSS